MSGLVILGIAASVLVMGAIGLMMFAEVAFAGPRELHKRSLPLLSGASLKAWGAVRSRFATGTWLASHPERTHSDELARGIESEVGQVLDQAVFQESPEARGVQRCQQTASVPQVTAPEVFAIAAELRNLPMDWREKVRQQASVATQMGVAACPLLTTQGLCLCAGARPIECRGRCLAGFDSSADAMEWAKTLEGGLLEGLQQELSGAGLDGRRYDLNRALALVLTDAGTESRWQRGEPLVPIQAEIAS